MCIICHKECGVKLPNIEILKACFESNRHGAGILVWRSGRQTAEIHKGYMSFQAFEDAYKKLCITDDDNVVFHFRISTAGGINRENCHPFPISENVEDLKKLDIENVQRALVHNGIIGAGDKDLSDTQLFIKYVLAQSSDIYEHLNDPSIQQCIEEFVPGNRYVIMDTTNNTCIRLGSGWYTDPETKLHFSNKSYMSQLIKTTTPQYPNYTSHKNIQRTFYQNPSDYGLKKETFNWAPKCTAQSDWDEFGDEGEFGQYEIVDICPVCKKSCYLTEVYDDVIYICNTCKSLINIETQKKFNMETKTWIRK